MFKKGDIVKYRSDSIMETNTRFIVMYNDSTRPDLEMKEYDKKDALQRWGYKRILTIDVIMTRQLKIKNILNRNNE